MQAYAADPYVTLSTTSFATRVTTAMFILDQGQNGFDVSRGILVGVIGVTTIRESNGLANHDTGGFGSVLEADVEIVEEQIRGGSLRAAKFFEARFFDDD